MSTPTSQPNLPPSASKKTATNHVTTPSHLPNLSSPASTAPAPPRSVPSPATTRRDPHKAPTPSTPMLATLSQQTAPLSASPLAGGPTPTNIYPPAGGSITASLAGGPGTGGTGTGASAATPGSAAAAAVMATTISELGLGLSRSVSNRARDEDGTRWRTMRRVLRRIGGGGKSGSSGAGGRRGGGGVGRIHEAGIARAARRVGFQTDIDEEPRQLPAVLAAERAAAAAAVTAGGAGGGAGGKTGRAGNRTIGIAGKTVLIDVELRAHVPRAVAVMFSGLSGAGAPEQGVAAGAVLRKDLEVGEEEGLIGSRLDGFAANLDRLARLDRLSEKINCFDAVGGIYDALRRLFEAEKRAVKALPGKEDVDDREVEMEVLRRRSGRPAIHARGKIGVVVDYWSPDPVVPGKADDAMEVDDASPTDSPTRMFSLRIEVESWPAGLYTPIRIATDWLAEDFELPPPDSDLGLPWQDPLPSYLDSSAATMDDLDPENRLPDVRFVAKLDPPIVVPSLLAMSIFSSLGVVNDKLYSYLPYHLALLNTPLDKIRANSVAHISSRQNVLIPNKDGQDSDVTHHYTLDVPKPEFACRLDELPFSHPRQIITLLPILRQWAHFGTLIKDTFTQPIYSSATEAVMTDGAVAAHDALPVIVSLMTSPIPTLTVTYADDAREEVRNTVVQVSADARLVTADAGGEDGVGKGDGVDGDAAFADVAMADAGGDAGDDDGDGNGEAKAEAGVDGKVRKQKKLAESVVITKALTACADVGVWVAWLRRQAGSGSRMIEERE